MKTGTPDVDDLLARLTRWAEQQADVRGLALVGSRARDAAHESSDLDLVLLTDSPSRYIEGDDWLAALGPPTPITTRQWGAVTERRFALPGGPDIDLGVTMPEWASVDPLDAGTRRVVSDGMRILYDPQNRLATLAAACR